MTDRARQPVLYVVACGGRAAGELAPFVKAVQDEGWDVCVVATPSALKFMNAGDLADLTGHPVRHDYKHPDEPDVLPPPDAMIVAPATFNTINKWAYGGSDTLALGLLNEAVGLGLPLAVAPTPNAALARHPAFAESVARLRSWGVAVLLDPGRLATGDTPPFIPWDALIETAAYWRDRRLPGATP
ncbi:Flavoprotein [Micromonospora pattaloongensis]|uniref:Flavoprotein n=1 Tax=Micromonospora pattaloongensis TaxID=405436 RepID=A0A1H3Q1U2_9ACTN|nr:flavoprotein [Micromonospora pattaloongensis]SDZ06709.1 Flavoprotein [Micromonospora pattaloongensis]